MNDMRIPIVDDQTTDTGTESCDKRQHLRFDKIFPVRIESALFGESRCIARNISAGGVFLETAEPLPLGTKVRVCFPAPDGSGDISAQGEVKNHYFINYARAGQTRSVSGMAVRFSSFEEEGAEVLQDCLTRMRVLH